LLLSLLTELVHGFVSFLSKSIDGGVRGNVSLKEEGASYMCVMNGSHGLGDLESNLLLGGKRPATTDNLSEALLLVSEDEFDVVLVPSKIEMLIDHFLKARMMRFPQATTISGLDVVGELISIEKFDGEKKGHFAVIWVEGNGTPLVLRVNKSSIC
jgi:hypothetical protein